MGSRSFSGSSIGVRTSSLISHDSESSFTASAESSIGFSYSLALTFDSSSPTGGFSTDLDSSALDSYFDN